MLAKQQTSKRFGNGEIDSKIAGLNFDRLRFKIVKEEDWSEEKCIRAENQYKKWLTIKKENPKMDIVPSKFIDEFWHYHVLDTRSYAQDCKNVFGYFLHHYPYLYTPLDRYSMLQCHNR